jgi:hypothetical protein
MTTNSIFFPSARRLALLHRCMTVTLVAALAVPAFVNATEPSTWIGTWSASPQPTWGADFAFPTNIPATLQEQTIRQVARISLGGKRIRIVLSNEYGSQPLVIGAAHVALADTGSAIVSETDRPITFGGKASAVVPPGAPIVSGIQIETAAPAGAVVVIGDSTTDGNGATIDANSRWPDFLAARLAPGNVAVLNAGISGARLLGDRMGVNALARFDRDVLSQIFIKKGLPS